MIRKLFSILSLLWMSSLVVKAQYCLPTFSIGCTSQDLINNFSTTGGLTNITNLATGCNGVIPNVYTFFNTMTVSQVQGASFNFSVQSGPSWAQSFGIWIDWNQDYDFDDPGEFVYGSPTSAITPFNGTINVPATAPPGITRMRVICRFVTTLFAGDYCGNSGNPFTFGECEDYQVEVLPTAPCAGGVTAGTVTPAGPLNLCAGAIVHLGLTGSTVTGGLTYNWEQSTNGGATWSNVIGGFGGTGPGYMTPALSNTTWYRCTITCSNSGLSATTPAHIINITSPLYASVPYTQDFETWTNFCATQDVPNDLHWSTVPETGSNSWRREDEGATASWPTPPGGFYLPTGSTNIHSARFHSYETNMSGDLNLYLNCNTPVVGNKTLLFDYINNNFTGWGFDSLEVFYSDNGGASFTPLGSYTNALTWTTHALIIPSNSANTIVKFRGYGDYQYDTDLGIDNVNILAPCTGAPIAGTIDSVSPCANVPFTLHVNGSTIAGGINYIWESAPTAGGPWTILGTTAAPFYTTTVTTNTYFRCTVQCQASGLSDVTPVFYAQLASFYTCYCQSQSMVNAFEQNIGNVSVINSQNVAVLNNGTATPLLNNLSPLNFYTSFYSLPPTNLYLDSTYDLKVTAFSKQSTFTNGYAKVYIDYNQDGVFDPVTENVGGGILNSGAQMMVANFQVPATTPTGITGMRVVYRVGGTATTTTPCGTYPDGETEDYLVSISLPPCLTPPNAGTATISDTVTCPGYILYLQASGYDVAYLNLTYNWQYSSDGINYSDIPGATLDTLSYTVNNQSWFRFRTTCNGTSDGYSNVLHVVMNPPFVCYGQSVATGGNADSSDIGAFIIYDSTTNNTVYSYVTGGPHLLNPTAVKNRTDRTGLGAMSLFTDSAYKFAVYHIMRSATHADARVTIFIDYNNNLQYDIPQERVFSGIAGVSTYYLYSFIRTPAFPAVNIPTGLRIVLNNETAPNSASDTGVGLYESGETEDYLVSFAYKQLPNSLEVNDNVKDISVYPNPSSGRVYLGLKALQSTPLKIQVLSITGAVAYEHDFGTIQGAFVNSLELGHLNAGAYILKFNAGDEHFVRRLIIE